MPSCYGDVLQEGADLYVMPGIFQGFWPFLEWDRVFPLHSTSYQGNVEGSVMQVGYPPVSSFIRGSRREVGNYPFLVYAMIGLPIL